MATYQLVAATGTTDANGLTTFTNRPADAVGLVTLDANGDWVPVPEAALGAGGQATSYTAGAGIDLTGNVISATDYTDAEVDGLLASKISKQEADTRYGQLATDNVWQRDQEFGGDAGFTSSYLPLRVRISPFGIVLDNKGAIATNIGNNYIQFSDSNVSARFVLLGGKLVFSGAVIEVADPTTPQGIASKAYVDQVAGAATGGTPGPTYTAGTGVDLIGTQFSSTRLELAAPQTGSYTLQLADAGKLVPFVNTSPAVLTFPANADVALPVGTIGYLRRQAAGALSLAAGPNVVLLPPGVALNVDDYAKVSYHKIDLNTYWLEGSLF